MGETNIMNRKYVTPEMVKVELKDSILAGSEIFPGPGGDDPGTQPLSKRNSYGYTDDEYEDEWKDDEEQ